MQKHIACINAAFAAALFLCMISCTDPREITTKPTPQGSYLIDTLTGTGGGATRLNQDKLDALVRTIELGLCGTVKSLVIIHNDALVLEKYFDGYDRHYLQRCNSVTKSIASALIGIAIDKGYISGVDAKLLDFFPEYAGSIENYDARKASITLEHLLTMSAGFEWNEANTSPVDWQGNPNPECSPAQMWASDDWIKFVLDLPVVTEPGAEFTYNSGITHLLSGIITRATGLNAAAFAEAHLFSPLGITKWKWPEDPQGNNDAGSGLWLHPANMAMFGYLYLKSGRLGDAQVAPESWVEASSFHHLPFDNWSPSMNKSHDYGYQWWLVSEKSSHYDPDNIGDIYYASGLGGQMIVVMPDIDMVVVLTCWDIPTGIGSYLALYYGILPAVERIASE